MNAIIVGIIVLAIVNNMQYSIEEKVIILEKRITILEQTINGETK